MQMFVLYVTKAGVLEITSSLNVLEKELTEMFTWQEGNRHMAVTTAKKSMLLNLHKNARIMSN